MEKALTIKNVTDRNADAPFWNAMSSVPLGNSKFQIENFVFKHQSPTRNFRQAMLMLRQDATALVSAQTHKVKEQVKIKKLERSLITNQAIIDSADSTKDAKFDAECEIEIAIAEISEAKFLLRSQEVLENDALDRIKTCLAIISKLPPCTKELFESEELGYWTKRFKDEGMTQLQSTGSVSSGLIESIRSIGKNPKEVFGEQFNPARISGNIASPKTLD